MKPSYPIPARMRHLERDRRGYAIPVIVLRDNTGKPHFTINDEALRQRCIYGDLCSICGTKLFRNRWAVAGPLSMLHEVGRVIDTPVHRECLLYALHMCPYIAAPNWNPDKRIDTKTLKPEDAPEHLVLTDPSMMTNRPPLFVAAMFRDVRWFGDNGLAQYYAPVRPYLAIEYWQHGKQLPQAEGEALARDYMPAQLERHLKGATP